MLLIGKRFQAMAQEIFYEPPNSNDGPDQIFKIKIKISPERLKTFDIMNFYYQKMKNGPVNIDN